MEPILKITDIDNVDLEQYCLLHKSAFKELLSRQNVSDNFLTPELFKWKYHTPAGKAKIALIENNGKIIAGMAIWPLWLALEGAIISAWHSGDVAVLPGERGKWFFAKCMNGLMAELSPGSFLFGFPNLNNAIGARRAGFLPIEQLGFFVKFSPSLLKRKRFKTASFFHNNQDEYAIDLLKGNKVGLYRSAEYMNWRYVRKPETDYYCFIAEIDNKVMGNVVVRVAEVRNKRILLVMEFHYLDKKIKSELGGFIKQIAAKEKCKFISMFSGKLFSPDFWTTGFVKIPQKFLPKNQILVGVLNNKEQSELLQKTWLIQTGDWDAF